MRPTLSLASRHFYVWTSEFEAENKTFNNICGLGIDTPGAPNTINSRCCDLESCRGWGSIPDQPPNYDGCHSRGRTGKMEFTCLFSRQEKKQYSFPKSLELFALQIVYNQHGEFLKRKRMLLVVATAFRLLWQILRWEYPSNVMRLWLCCCDEM